ncbi:MAG TPA: hypothetical protein VEG39_16300, partial [Clostridia bacterium]|nr:hypothetical protein [Clostridia bacterium]
FSIRTVIISFALFMCVNFLINGSPYGLTRLVEITGGQSILDMEMLKGYSVERAYEILEALGEEGRTFNMRYIVPLDFPFPLSYGLFYFVTLTLIMQSIRKNMGRPWLIGIVGLVAALFDWLENIMIIRLLQNYPTRLEGVAKLASVFTQLKSLFVMGSMLIIVVGLVVVIIKKLTGKHQLTQGGYRC